MTSPNPAVALTAPLALLTADPDGIITIDTTDLAPDTNGIADALPGALLAGGTAQLVSTFSGAVSDPDALVATPVATSASADTIETVALDGTLADGTDGYLTGDFARRITVTASASAGSYVEGSTFTVNGTDVFGDAIAEVLAVPDVDGDFSLTTDAYFAVGSGNEISCDIEAQADTDGAWTVGVTGDLRIYLDASFDGAGADDAAIAGSVDRLVTATSASDTGAYNITDPIIVRDLVSGASHEIQFTDEDGVETASSVTRVAAGAGLIIDVPEQQLATAEITIGLGPIYHPGQTFAGAALDGAGVTDGAVDGDGMVTPTATTAAVTGAYTAGSRVWFATASTTVSAVLADVDGGETVTADGPIPAGEALLVYVEPQVLPTADIDLGFVRASLNYEGADLDGAEITDGALEGDEPRNVTVQFSNTAGGFVAGSSVIVTGRDPLNRTISETFTVPTANGNVTVTGVEMFRPEAPLIVTGAGQTTTTATITIGTGAAKWIGAGARNMPDWLACIGESGGTGVFRMRAGGALQTLVTTAPTELPFAAVSMHEGSTDDVFAGAWAS